MSRRALALLVVACAGLACPRSGPSVAPTPAGTTPAAAEPAAEPIATPGPALPPWMQALFDPGLRRTYAWTYAVDTHSVDEADAVAEAEGTLRCRSDGPTRHELGTDGVAWVSCQACELTIGKDDGFEPDFDDCYLATTAGLWLVDAPPRSATEVRALVATPPYLPATPEPRNETQPVEGDGFEHETWTRVEQQTRDVLGRRVTAWCRNDGHSQMYGENVTRCFAPGYGLVALDWDGRSGPSTEAYPLVAIDPLPPQ